LQVAIKCLKLFWLPFQAEITERIKAGQTWKTLGDSKGLEQQGVIRAFDKRTMIELSGDVMKEIAQKYKKVQEGIGEMMSEA